MEKKMIDNLTIDIRGRDYERMLIEERIFPQRMARSENNILGIGQFSLMHAHFLALESREMYKDEENEMAFYLLGVVEAILSGNKLLTLDKMLY